LDANRTWSESIRRRDPDFFPRLARQQSPDYLWIGCADSRVPANEIVGLAPGELFVHRNVANVVVHTDLNCLSVLQYAVEVLKVRHVIVCGHYGCGGVKAALNNERHGLIDNWLRHVQDVVERHQEELATIADTDVRADRLCELNVIEQVVNVCQTTVVAEAWRRRQPLDVHGWIYGLGDGLLRDLGLTVSSPAEVPSHAEAARGGQLTSAAKAGSKGNQRGRPGKAARRR
jgi:carbonic anhydrase